MGLRASVCANGVRPCGCPRGLKSLARRDVECPPEMKIEIASVESKRWGWIELAYTGNVSDTVQPRLDMTREFSPTAKECPMKSHLLLTASGPLLILTSHESLHDPNLLEKLKHKGIGKFVAFEVPVSLARERYGGHFRAVESDLHETDDLRVLDFNGQRVFQLFRFDELGAPILREQP
jgi:hypothetical protein